MKENNSKEYELSSDKIGKAKSIISKMGLLNTTIAKSVGTKENLSLIHDYMHLYHDYLTELNECINYDIKVKSNEQKLKNRIKELVEENNRLRDSFVDWEVDIFKIKNFMKFFKNYISQWWYNELSLGCVSEVMINQDGVLKVNLSISLEDFASILRGLNFECNKDYRYQEYNLDICKFLGTRLLEPTDRNKAILKEIVKSKFGECSVFVKEVKGFINVNLKQDNPKTYISNIEVFIKDVNSLINKINKKC
ncbi:hypothetical protein ACV3RR_04980 [Clostridium perfringens]